MYYLYPRTIYQRNRGLAATDWKNIMVFLQAFHSVLGDMGRVCKQENRKATKPGNGERPWTHIKAEKPANRSLQNSRNGVETSLCVIHKLLFRALETPDEESLND